MISAHATKRWDIIDKDVKDEIGMLLKDTLRSSTISITNKLAAASLAERIDRLNLKHEELYTPKLTVDFTNRSTEDLEAELEELTKLKSIKSTLDMLTKVTDAEMLEDTAPMMDALPHATAQPLDKYIPPKNTPGGDREKCWIRRVGAGTIPQ